jgi:hypothetical protein
VRILAAEPMTQTLFRRILLAIALLGLAGTARADDDTLARIREEMRASPPSTAVAYRAYFDRLGRIRGEEARAERMILLDAYLSGPGADDEEARASAAQVSFRRLERQVASDPSAALDDLVEPGRRLELVEAIPSFREQRWLVEPQEIADALDALRRLDRATRSQAADPVFRAGVRAEANLATDPYFGPYSRATKWGAPWLVVYTDGERLTPYDSLKLSPKTREALRAEWARKRAAFQPIADAYAERLTALTEEFYRRYGERLGLKTFAAEFGGRPDYPEGVRSFYDGVPIPVVVFAGLDAFRRHHAEVVKDPIASLVDAYFSLQTGWVYGAEDADHRLSDDDHVLRCCVRALLYWSSRQGNRWRLPPRDDPGYLATGFSIWFAGSRVSDDGRAFFSVTSREIPDRMADASARLRASPEPGRSSIGYPVFPLERLTRFRTLRDAGEFAQDTWGLPGEWGMFLFQEQSWALVRFLNEFDGGKHADRFVDLLGLTLSRVASGEAFRHAMGIGDAAGWARLNAEFQRYVREELLPR